MKSILVILLTVLLFEQIRAQETNSIASVSTKDSIILSGSDEKIFRELTLRKIRSFQSNLSKIASKNNSKSLKQSCRVTILENFINKGIGVTMEISTISGGSEKRIRKPLIAYLDNLCTLQYAEVKLKAAKSCIVSNLVKSGIDPNGYPVYMATATYYQEFIGYNNGEAIYKDITQKTVVIQITFTTDLDQPRWVVNLGDISVEETKTQS
jgi:hypothetical protein